MHPERKGQTDGKVDVGIAVLDGVGLLFFIIPGVIAYAVDISNGTIYLPGGPGKTKGKKSARAIQFDPNAPRLAQIEQVLRRETGRDVHLEGARGWMVQLRKPEQLPPFFAGAKGSVPDMVVSDPASPSSGR